MNDYTIRTRPRPGKPNPWEWEVTAKHLRRNASGVTLTRRGAIREAKRWIEKDKAGPPPWTTYKENTQ